MKLVTVQITHNKRPLKMRVAKEDIYTRACSIPKVRFEDQELTSFGGIVVFQKLFTCAQQRRSRSLRFSLAKSFGGIVVFQKLFAKLNLKERLRRCCAHVSENNLYHPAVIVQLLI